MEGGAAILRQHIKRSLVDLGGGRTGRGIKHTDAEFEVATKLGYPAPAAVGRLEGAPRAPALKFVAAMAGTDFDGELGVLDISDTVEAQRAELCE